MLKRTFSTKLNHDSTMSRSDMVFTGTTCKTADNRPLVTLRNRLSSLLQADQYITMHTLIQYFNSFGLQNLDLSDERLLNEMDHIFIQYMQKRHSAFAHLPNTEAPCINVDDYIVKHAGPDVAKLFNALVDECSVQTTTRQSTRWWYVEFTYLRERTLFSPCSSSRGCTPKAIYAYDVWNKHPLWKDDKKNLVENNELGACFAVTQARFACPFLRRLNVLYPATVFSIVCTRPTSMLAMMMRSLQDRLATKKICLHHLLAILLLASRNKKSKLLS